MFVRKKKNKSGSINVQIIDKSSGNYKVVKTIGSTKDKLELRYLLHRTHKEISELLSQEELPLYTSNDKELIEFLRNDKTLKVRVTGPEDILGRLFDKIGFNRIEDTLFRDLVITQLIHPVSKLKTVDYLRRYNNRNIEVDQLYRILDRLSNKYKSKLEEIAFEHTKTILQGKVGIVFYDITTLYFEASTEDDLRRIGFSKDGKAHPPPKILLGLLVGISGYPIGYDIYEGNKYEGKTFIPILKKYIEKFKISNPIIIADSGLLSDKNVAELEKKGYRYILGARIKKESKGIRDKILRLNLSDAELAEIKRDNKRRLIINYSRKRAKKDMCNRKRGLRRLQKLIVSKQPTKKQINNRGYNKYLKLSGTMKVEIDCQKYKEDAKWDGLKGYITNSKLSSKKVIENYSQLWQIEKAFRISKTDLNIRPINHRLKSRIGAHISIAFAAYTIYKELERLLYKKNAPFSVKRALELMQTIYTLDFTLPDTKTIESVKVSLSDEQKLLYHIVNEI